MALYDHPIDPFASPSPPPRRLHAQAAEDEEAAVSSALAWAFQQWQVPHVRACTLRQRLRA